MDCFVALLLAMTRTETIMMDHENRVRDEFTRQAATFSASPAITDAALTQRFVDALGESPKPRDPLLDGWVRSEDPDEGAA